MSNLDPNIYTVAWIAPLYIEAKAALLMLDKQHRGHFPVSRGDDYVYHAGTICRYNVVIATLPAGQEYGTGSAAALASQVRKFFPNIWFGLLVGVAAGLPNLARKPKRDIRLGDILVALPDGDTAALVAYDLGKETGGGGFQPLRLGHALAHTETIVRSAIGKIKLAPNEAELFMPYYEKMIHEEHEEGCDFRDPGQEDDKLYEFSLDGKEYEVIRQPRPKSRRTRVWYGPIGSGEKLMKNGCQRNELRDRFNIIGLEMEAAGTMNRIPVGVIRGVCDYADEHKNKEWQPYAAAMAAAYAKAVLQEIFPGAKDELASRPAGHSCGSYLSDCYIISRDLRADFMMIASHSGRGVDPIQQDHFLGPYLSSISSGSRKRRHSYDKLSSDSGGDLSIPAEKQRFRRSDGVTFNSGSDSRKVEPLKKPWPEYQTERPGLSAKYTDRCDTPPQLSSNSEIWHTVDRIMPWNFLAYGLPGVGKSQLCLKAISEQQHRFRSVFYIDASEKTTADSNYIEISRVCHLQHHWEDMAVDEQIRITRAWLSCQNEPWLLMIDNVNKFSLPLDRYIPSGGNGTVLITSTDARWATSCHAYCQIRSMADGESLELFLKYKDPAAELDVHETQLARTIAVQELGGLPLAIAQAGSYIFNSHCTYSEYLEELRDVPQGPLDEGLPVVTQNQHQKTIWCTLTLSIRGIQELPERGSTEAIDLLRIMSFLHADGIDERMFQEAWRNMQECPSISKRLKLLDSSEHRWDTPVIRSAFGILCRYSILTPVSFSKRQYSLHRLAQTVCKSLLPKDKKDFYASQAIGLVATALAGIKTPFSWIEDPAGVKLQNLLIPHIASCVEGQIGRLFRDELYGDFSPESLASGAEILSLFAKAYATTGHHMDAQEFLAKGWDILESKGYCDDETSIVLKLMEQQATCNAQIGWHLKAHSLREKIYAIRKSQSLADSNNYCAALINLSDSTWILGKREEALVLSERCLDLREKTLLPQDPRLSRARRKVAEHLHGTNHKKRALSLRELVFHHAELKGCPTDVERLDFLATKTALADSYQWDGRYYQALQLRKDVYEGRNNILGPDHPETLLAHDRLLVTQSTLTDEPEEQKGLCRLLAKSVIIWKRTLGKSHPHFLEAKVRLGLAYSKLQEFSKAIGQLKSVLAFHEREYYKSSGSKTYYLFPYLSSMGKLASVFSKAGRLSKALKIRRKAAILAEAYYGPHDPVTLTASNKLLNCEAALGHITSEEVVEKRQGLLSDQKRFLNPEGTQTHPVTLGTMSFLAVDFEAAGHEAIDAGIKPDKHMSVAIHLRRHLLAAQKVSLGPENRATLGNMRRLASMLTAKYSSSCAQIQEAISFLEEIEAVQQRLLGTGSFQARDTRKELMRISSTSYSGSTSSSNRVIQDERNSEDNVEADSSRNQPVDYDSDYYYASSLPRKLTKVRGPIEYSDFSSDDFTSESGTETSDGESSKPKVRGPIKYSDSSSDDFTGESGSEASDGESSKPKAKSL